MGRRVADESEDRHEAVKKTVLVVSRPHSQGDRDHKKQDKGQSRKVNRGWNPFSDDDQDRAAVPEGIAKIKGTKTLKPVPILEIKRVLQAVENLEFFNVTGIDVGAHGGVQGCRVAGGEMHDQETEDGYPQEEWDHHQQAPDQEFTHNFSSSTSKAVDSRRSTVKNEGMSSVGGGL